MTTMKQLLGACSLLLLIVFFTQCKEDDSTNPKGTASIEITDGPLDDANVSGVFVTIAAVKVDGKEISGFSKQTIDLMAYQQGETKLLGTTELEAGTYGDVTLVLDFEKDASGTSPGSYVLTKDNVKHDLQSTTSTTLEVKSIDGDFEVKEANTTNVVLDFDLRKAIRYEDSPQTTDQYDFVTKAELGNSIRFVEKEDAGQIGGKSDDNLGIGGDKIVVYAYTKGSYNKQTELEGQGDSDVQFSKAVTSASVDAQGSYKLAFLQPGNYELHFYGYDDANNDGKLEVMGELDLNLVGNLGLDLNNIAVGAGANVAVSVLVIGILP